MKNGKIEHLRSLKNGKMVHEKRKNSTSKKLKSGKMVHEKRKDGTYERLEKRKDSTSGAEKRKDGT